MNIQILTTIILKNDYSLFVSNNVCGFLDFIKQSYCKMIIAFLKETKYVYFLIWLIQFLFILKIDYSFSWKKQSMWFFSLPYLDSLDGAPEFKYWKQSHWKMIIIFFKETKQVHFFHFLTSMPFMGPRSSGQMKELPPYAPSQWSHTPYSSQMGPDQRMIIFVSIFLMIYLYLLAKKINKWLIITKDKKYNITYKHI